MSTNIDLGNIPYSVLDLAPITKNGTASEAFKNTVDLAQHTEAWGYKRFWLAEHHNMPGIASSATSVLIGHVANETSTIRVGSGGIMLPNHSPLVIAEQFGTLESLFPGRIDLGLGRAPGTDQMTMRAIRRDPQSTGDDFPEMLEELRAYFDAIVPKQVRAFPGEGLRIPIWLLGSSGFSARLSAKLGLPFAFASHFSPENTIPALQLYYNHFQPSEILDEPYAMVGINIIAADTEDEAKYLSTSMQQQFLNLIRHHPTQLQPPVKDIKELCSEYEFSILEKQLASTFIGNREQVRSQLVEFLDKTKANEIIINGQIYEHKARLRSFEIVSDLMK